ncbi:MAG: 23S rRNA (cytosine1962-C5)-methyltransferase, partial [Methylococcaceae bacterium NSP1-2]
MHNTHPKIPREYAAHWSDYELLDAGDGKKLERWGKIITIRPDIHADFKSGWSYAQWQDMAHWEFEEHSTTQGQWKNIKSDAGLNFQQRVRAGQKILNLFAYTGAASLVACDAGAEVVHVDSVKQLITWANENKERSHLADIKWVHEDALKFAQRELKRGKHYDGIIMDPPAWGLGAKGEKWKLEHHLSGLIETAFGLMNSGAFLILNTYSPKIELSDLAASAGLFFTKNQVEIKQLWMPTKTGK